MGQRAYCDREHPVGDREADDWCETYHRPVLPRVERDEIPVEYCDYCEREGHTFRSCPARDDESLGDFE